ncbi:MAG: hypothetical protein HY304_00915 [candidate division Zixibacteria bacterium]|nr:hypothetical protein [candidate division Zixibacteria bacterium]
MAIDSSFTLGYVIAADANSDKVAIVLHSDREPQFHGLNNVAYYESQTAGAGWIDGSELGDAHKRFITEYTDPAGPQAFLHISTAYDNAGVLHVIWDEQRFANVTNDVAIRHWNNVRATIRPVALGYWPAPWPSGMFNLNLAKLTLGVGDGATLCSNGPGDGTNRDYLYAVYTQFGGPGAAEQADHSRNGYMNGELYLTVSNSGGNTWSVPRNLTNTKTPNCNPGPGDPAHGGLPPRPDSVCRSEHWATIGQLVHDVDIIYISDLDAGGIPQSEGFWEMDPVMYLRLPGGTTDAPYLCPLLGPNFAASINDNPLCEYHARRGGFTEAALTVTNIGNATMTGNIASSQINGPPGWLTLLGGGAYTIPAGDPDLIMTVHMDATAITIEGLYQGTVTVSHNDTTQTSPQIIPIDFFVFDQFYCPVSEIPRTGSLALEVSSNGRFASQNREGGLWRFQDSSSSIYDASLLVAHGSQSPDTTVFYRFGVRNTRGQFGYRAQGDLVLNTAAYGTQAGFAQATADMTTKDSAVWLRWEWYFPQHPDSDEFVICRLSVWDRDATPVTDLLIGVLVDFDVVPAIRYGSIQRGTTNKPGFDVTRNLLWQQGVDTANTPPSPTITASRFRGGISVLTNGPLCGARIGNSGDIQSQDGPSDEFLYRALVNLSGIDVYSDRDTDLYTMVKLAQFHYLIDTDTLNIVWALVSDTSSTSDVAIRALADKAAAWATANGITSHFPQNSDGCGCSCPCHADPACDGVTNVLDVVQTIGMAFRGAQAITDPGCPKQQCDMDCNNVCDVLDVVKIIGVAFRGVAASTICNPCG